MLEPLVLFNSPLPGGQVNAPYAESVVASGGDGSYTWSVSAGALPAGLSLGPGSGAITGTPNTAGAAAHDNHAKGTITLLHALN